MKKLYLLLAITLLSDLVFGQMKPKEVDAIKSDTTLYWGLSRVCNTLEEATDMSMDELYENIAKNCNSHAIYLANNGDNQLENIVKTFKERIDDKVRVEAVIEDEKKDAYQYISWMKRSEFRAMCNDRKHDIGNFIAKGVKQEEDACLEDALKSYYWSLMLIYAHPQGKVLHFDVPEINENIDSEWLIDRINGSDGILKSFNFIVPKDDAFEEEGSGVMVKLRVKNKHGMDVKNLRCDCYDGRKFIPNTVRDGKLMVQLREKNIKTLKIKVDYIFEDDAKKMNIDVANAIALIKGPRFSNSINVDLSKTKTVKPEEEVQGWNKIESNRPVAKNVYLEKMQIIENAMRSGNIASARDCFSESGYGMIDTLSHYGKMTVVGKPDYKFLKYNDEVLCRSITVQFDFRNTPGFSQDVVFRFDTINKVVTSLAFRLSDQAEYDIVSKTKWPESSRLLLVNFLEDYQTAYALKRHHFLESIYSDDALIIVGRFVKRAPDLPDRMTLKQTTEEAELTKYDKDTYMKNLRTCFGNNEYIRLRFTETDFNRANNTNDVYGIRVRQEYFSSSYGDVGYLFLLVDLRHELPTIHVRAWQPDKVDLDKLMNMGDVRFN